MTSISSNLTRPYESSKAAGAHQDEPVFFGLTTSAWLKIGVITLLMGMVFWPNLRRLWYKTNPINGEPNWGHAIVVPFIGLYYLYINRESLLASEVRTAWSGLGILLAGILLFAYGIWPGQNDYTKDLGMVITLFGTVTLLCGWQVIRIAWFPIAFLICALPWPGLVYSQIAGPLQHLAAEVAVHVLSFSGVEAAVSGTKIIMASSHGARTLNVAEACAGLRSLMTFVSVAAAVAFLTTRPLWQRIVLVVSSVPIAIFCNVMRVAGQGLLDHYVSPALSEGFAHQFVGLIMLIPAFFLILLTAWILDRLFIDEVSDQSGLKQRRIASAAHRVAPVASVGVGARAVATTSAATQPTPRPAAAPRPQTLPPRPGGLGGHRQSTQRRPSGGDSQPKSEGRP